MSTGIPVGASSRAMNEAVEDARDAARSEALLEQRQSPSIFVVGEIGVGKTTLLRTLLKPETGIKRLVIISLEPGAYDVLGDLPPEQCYIHYLPPTEGSFDQLISMTKNVMNMTLDAMQQSGNWNKTSYPQFMELLQLCNNFVDSSPAKRQLGPVFEFGPDTALILDSTTALTDIARNASAGDLPFLEMRQYQVIQSLIRKFLNHLVFSTKCVFVATGHLEREVDENTGMSRLMVSTVGRKLAPIIPRYFSDMVLMKRTEDNSGKATFSMATSDPNIKLKTRNLPFSNNLAPDLAPLIVNFNKKQRNGLASGPADAINQAMKK